MKLIWVLLLALCLLAAGITVFVWSGVYNVSAAAPHWKITHWLLGKVRDRSVSAHSKNITPPSLDNPKLVDSGFREFHEMCRLCHGAPGYSRTDIAKGLYPPPPDFTSKDMKMLKETELYWIIDNGIKMTGMPAFGPTHSKDELWGIVAFVRHLQKMNPKEYQAMVKAAGVDKEKEDHHH